MSCPLFTGLFHILPSILQGLTDAKDIGLKTTNTKGSWACEAFYFIWKTIVQAKYFS